MPFLLGCRIRLAWPGMSAIAGILLALAAQGASAHTSDARQCSASGGMLLEGRVIGEPRFSHGRYRKGIELSHAHLKIRSEDGRTYKVAIDNVFASGYRPGMKTVPAPLNAIAAGARVQACGMPFRGGIHWVHDNCGDTPGRSDPDGWLKVIQADGRAGPNLEASRTYCYLWPRH